jgi:transcriptional regulator with XRE-family HTH domain
VSDLRSAFGLVIRAARERRGWSQEQLSHVAGLDRTYVSSLERGLRNPTLVTQDRLARALGTPLHELIREAEGDA